MISLLKLVVFIVAIITAIFGHLTHRRNVTTMTLFKLCSIGTNPFVLIERMLNLLFLTVNQLFYLIKQFFKEGQRRITLAEP